MKKYLFLVFMALPVLALELSQRNGFLSRKYKFLLPESKTARLPVTIDDVTEESGVDYTFQIFEPTNTGFEHIKGWVLGSGATVSVSDVDLDGFQDLYFTSMKPGVTNKLYRNQGDGTFRDETSRFFSWATNTRWISLKPTFFDCDNDGDQDLFLNTSSCPVLYRNESGKGFTDITEGSGLSVCHAVNGNVVDADNDGLLDLVYASYNIYGADRQMDNFMNADRSLQFMGMFRNKGQCRFEAMKDHGISDVGLTHVIGVVDLRGMNRKDLWFVTDVGTDRLFLDNGNGTYTNRSDLLAWSFTRHGMSFDVSYEGEQKSPLVNVSNIYEPTFMIEGNSLWRLDEKEKLTNIARESGVAECGHAWGSKFQDIDLDGDEDLLVTNGFVSLNPKKDYLFPLALLGQTHRGYMKHARNWPKMNDASLYGYQKNCLFIREGDNFVAPETPNAFTEDLLDGRAIATVDTLNDGRTTIVVANQLQPVKLFRTSKNTENNWIGFRLRGTCSNRDAFGSRIRLESHGKIQQRWYYPSNGYSSQTEGQIIFGVGKNSAVEKVTVHWPRGNVESFSGLALNQYHTLSEGGPCAR